MKKSFWCRLGWHDWTVLWSMSSCEIENAASYVVWRSTQTAKVHFLQDSRPATQPNVTLVGGSGRDAVDRICSKCGLRDFNVIPAMDAAVEREKCRVAQEQENDLRLKQLRERVEIRLRNDLMPNDLSACEYSAGLQRDVMRHDPPAGPDTDCTPQDHPGPAPTE